MRGELEWHIQLCRTCHGETDPARLCTEGLQQYAWAGKLRFAPGAIPLGPDESGNGPPTKAERLAGEEFVEAISGTAFEGKIPANVPVTFDGKKVGEATVTVTPSGIETRIDSYWLTEALTEAERAYAAMPQSCRPVVVPPEEAQVIDSIASGDLLIGVTYTVQFRDCCIRGGFTSVLLEKDIPDDVDPDSGRLAFSNGVVLETWNGIRFADA